MSFCLPDLLRKYDSCLGKNEVEEKNEEVLDAVHNLKFKNNLIRNNFSILADNSDTVAA